MCIFSTFSLIIHSQNASLNTMIDSTNRALTNNDIENYYKLAKECYALNSFSISVLYNLAVASALQNKTEESVKTIERLLKNDVSFEYFKDPVFDTLKNNEAFIVLKNEFEGKKKIITNSSLAFEIAEKDLIPEGITYDPISESFFLGSLTKCKIVKINNEKNVSDFIKPFEYDFLPVLGMNVDTKNSILWANSCYGYKKEGIPEEKFGIAGIYKLNINDGSLIKHYTLPQKENHFLNDVAINKNGDVFMSDSHIPAVYTISEKKDEIEKLCDLPTGSYPNGITISNDNKTLFIATTYAIYTYHFDKKQVRRLEIPNDQIYSACDGLYFYNNSLIGVQSFMKQITRFYLNDERNKVTKQEILESNNELFDTPTTGVIVGKSFYLIANAQLGKIDDDGKVAPTDQLNTTKILEIKIEE